MQKKVTTYRIVAGMLPIAVLVLAGIMTQLTTGKIKEKIATTETMTAKTQSYQDAVSFNTFLESQSVGLEKMNMAVPSESMVVGVVQDIESIIRLVDPVAKVQLSASTPVRIGQDLVVPMNITMSSTLEQIPTMLEDISTLPYLIQIISTQSQGSGNLFSTVITMRLYVQEPFAGY